MEQNQQMAKRNNTQHDYLLRGLLSCARCQYAYSARTVQPGYAYYACTGRQRAERRPEGPVCTAPYVPASALDQIVWADITHVLSQPALITHELTRAQAGA